MDDVSGELGISKKTVYKYFESKNQLISEIVDSLVEIEKQTFLEEVKKRSHWLEKLEVMLTVFTPDDIPYKLIDELYRYFPREKEKIEELVEFRQSIILPLIVQGQGNVDICPDLDPAIIFLVLYKIFMTPTDPKVLEANDITIKQLLDQMKKLFFHGILETAGGKI
jgi:AcrR family transcriptional regulator